MVWLNIFIHLLTKRKFDVNKFIAFIFWVNSVVLFIFKVSFLRLFITLTFPAFFLNTFKELLQRYFFKLPIDIGTYFINLSLNYLIWFRTFKCKYFLLGWNELLLLNSLFQFFVGNEKETVSLQIICILISVLNQNDKNILLLILLLKYTLNVNVQKVWVVLILKIGLFN